MVRSLTASTKLSIAGIATTLAAAHTDGNMFVNSGRTFVIVNNADGASKTFTFQTPRTEGGNLVDELIVTVTSTTERLIGPFPPATYNQIGGADAGRVYLDFEDFADATLAVFEL